MAIDAHPRPSSPGSTAGVQRATDGSPAAAEDDDRVPIGAAVDPPDSAAVTDADAGELADVATPDETSADAAAGEPDTPLGVGLGDGGRRLVQLTRLELMGALAIANLSGVAVVVACITWVLPGESIQNPHRVVALNAILGGAYLVLVVPASILWGEAWLRSGRRWLQEGRAPTDREVTAVLHAPIRLFTVHATTWLVAAAAFALLNGLLDVHLLARVAFTVALGGLTTSAFTYLLAERITRPLAAAALSIHNVDRPKLPGVITRTMIGWAMGSGIPLLGLVITGFFSLVDPNVTVTQLSVTMMVIGGIGLVVGWWVTVLGARAVADPVASLRHGMAELADGDLDARVEVYDGSVLGLLQSGFNDMATGLQERERLRDLYGRQVGEDVARESLERGSALGGELREVAVLFVDVVGSTTIASSRPADEVVVLLNRFFGVVVEEVHRHGGWVNKFQGDATLAVFGAPAAVDDAAGRALATARCIAARLPHEVRELSAGIGVAFGPAVAGNIGDHSRYEFTVIGDPVNEASRLTELAKTYRPMVLASSDAIAAASADEADRWLLDGETDLRGRDRPTRLARPRT